MARMANTPWLQEGIAEFWGSYEGNKYSGFKFRKFLFERYSTIQRAADDYYDWLKKSPEERKKHDKFHMTAREIVGITPLQFQRARRLASGLAAIEGVELAQERVETNIVYFDVAGAGLTAATVLERVAEHGVRMKQVTETKIRAVMHLDIADGDVGAAVTAVSASLTG